MYGLLKKSGEEKVTGELADNFNGLHSDVGQGVSPGVKCVQNHHLFGYDPLPKMEYGIKQSDISHQEKQSAEGCGQHHSKLRRNNGRKTENSFPRKISTLADFIEFDVRLEKTEDFGRNKWNRKETAKTATKLKCEIIPSKKNNKIEYSNTIKGINIFSILECGCEGSV